MMVVGATVDAEEAEVEYVFNSSHQLYDCGRVRLTNIWYIKSFLGPLNSLFSKVSISFSRPASLYFEENVYIYIYMCVCVCVCV